MACFVFSEPVTALILTIKPLQSWPSVDEGSKIVISANNNNYMACICTHLSSCSRPGFLFAQKSNQESNGQVSQGEEGLAFWQELHSPLVHRLHVTFKVTQIYVWLFWVKFSIRFNFLKQTSFRGLCIAGARHWPGVMMNLVHQQNINGLTAVLVRCCKRAHL